jgi:hypothetical protein
MLVADYIKLISPGWAQDGQLERYLFAIGDSVDEILEKIVQGQKMHMPGVGAPSGLDRIGDDRLIARGGTESDESFALTLQESLDLWAQAGIPWAVLRQTLRPLLTLRPAIKQISNSYDPSVYPWALKSTTWDTYDAGDTPETTQPDHQLDQPGNFDWDSVVTCPGSWNWKRFWIVIESVGADAWCNPRSDTWDDPSRLTWDTVPGCWDLDADPALLSAIWDKIQLWKRACECVALIISFDASHFDKDQPSGGGINPDGTCGRWSTYGAVVAHTRLTQIQGRTSITGAVFGHRVQ